MTTSAAWQSARTRRRQSRERTAPRVGWVPGRTANRDDEMIRLSGLAQLMRRAYIRPVPPPDPPHVMAKRRSDVARPMSP